MPPAFTHDSTTAPSHLQLYYDLAAYVEAARQVDLSPITDCLPVVNTTGRPRIFREELAIILLASRSRQTDVPSDLGASRKMVAYLRANGELIRSLFSCDKIPSRNTIVTALRELNSLGNQFRIVQEKIRPQLQGKDGTPKRLHQGKPQAIGQATKARRKADSRRRRTKRNTDKYRKARLGAALGLFQFTELYPDEATAESAFIDARWPDGVVTCPQPRCGSEDVVEVRRRKRRTWRCRACGRSFHAVTCTTFQGTYGSWRTLLLAIYFCLQFPYDSSLTMATALKTDERTMVHKTALRIQHRIFLAMDEALPPLQGYFQTDDTLIGYVQVENTLTGNTDAVPIAILGMVSEDTGHVKIEVVRGQVKRENWGPFIERGTDPQAIMLSDATNDCPFGVRIRLIVNHSKPLLSWPGPRFAQWYEEFRKLVTTNKIENFWRILKMLLLAHRGFTLRHLHLYVNAAAWHATHLMEPIEDQMKALIRNSHAVWVRAATEVDDTPLEFNLELQPVSPSNQPEPDNIPEAVGPCKDQTPLPDCEQYTEHLPAA